MPGRGADPRCARRDRGRECDEADAEEVEAWLEKAMLDGMDEVINASGAGGPLLAHHANRGRSALAGHPL